MGRGWWCEHAPYASYQIEEDRVVVLVIRVAPRGEVYW